MPASRFWSEGKIRACPVPNFDAGPYGVVDMAIGGQGHARSDGGDRRLLEPVWHVLCHDFKLILANASHIRNVPGRKSDANDATWIAD